MILVKIEPDSVFAGYNVHNETSRALVDRLLGIAYAQENIKDGTTMSLVMTDLPNGFTVILTDVVNTDSITLFVLSRHFEEIDEYMTALEKVGGNQDAIPMPSKEAHVVGERSASATESLSRLTGSFDVAMGTIVIELGDDDHNLTERAYIAKIPNGVSVLKSLFPALETATAPQVLQ